MLKKILTRSILLFLLIAAIAASEIFLRYLYSVEHNTLVSRYKDVSLSFQSDDDPGLIYSFIPNKPGVNSKGFFDYEYPYEKKEGIYRIVTIGDSVAQGEGVELEDVFSKVLEKKLNQEAKDKKYEVIILAVAGYSTSQELILLEDEALKYEPDLILWSYVLNDPAHPVYHNANGDIGAYFFKPKIHLLHFFARKFFYFKENIKGRYADREYHKFLHDVYWKETAANIKKIGMISKKKKIPIIFLIHPIFEKSNSYAEYSLTKLHQKLAEEAKKAGLSVLDLLEPYKNYNQELIKQTSETVWFDCWHPNEKGHRIAAHYIYDYLVNGVEPRVDN